MQEKPCGESNLKGNILKMTNATAKLKLFQNDSFTPIKEEQNALFRLGVGVVLERDDGRIFYALRSDEDGQGDWVVDEDGEWVMPQGGIDKGDDIISTLKRELFEEAGIRPEHIQPVAQRPDFLAYKFEPLIEPATWIGQAHCWVHCKFLGDPEKDINLGLNSPQEFQDYGWKTPHEIVQRAQPFHREIYKEVLKGFGFLPEAKAVPVIMPAQKPGL